ncbi:MAG: hypothetical protein H7A51_18560 [Akkermansiaceae bacterium]|nr:hypothetical protein [Akkermansiaceae bacterium]
MKNSLILALVCIALGFAAGWLAKPEALAPEETETASRPASRSASPFIPQGLSETDTPKAARRSGVTVKTVKAGEEMDPEMKKRIEDSQRKQNELARKRIADKNDMLIAAMVKELGLNAEQEQALRAFYAAQMEKIEFGDGMAALADPQKMKEMAAALRGDGLNDAMKNLLSAEQMDGLEAMQERQKNNVVEARAMKDLAKLQQALDLSEDQKQKVYNVLMEDAEKSLATQSDADYVTRSMMSGMGIEMDFGDMDMGSVMNLHVEGENAPADRAAIIQRLKETRRKQIDEKVDRLAPILNETQQQQYRKSLESQGGMFNMMIQGMDGVEVEAGR